MIVFALEEHYCSFRFLFPKLISDGPKLRRRNSETFRVQYMDTKAIRSFDFSAYLCILNVVILIVDVSAIL